MTRTAWISFKWIEITAVGDPDRMFVDCGHRTPDEGAKAADDWDKWFPSYRGS